MGWLLGTIGGNIPILKTFLAVPQFLSLLVPSIMVFFNLLNQNVLDSTDIFNETSKLSLFLYCLFSLWKYPWNEPQKFLVQGLMRMIVPMALGMIFSNGRWDPCWNAVRSRLET